MHIVSKPQLSLWEKLQLAAKLLILTPPRFAFYSARLLYFASTRGLSLTQYLICAGVRILFTFTGRQLQYLLPSSAEKYQAWTAAKRRKHAADPATLERLAVDIQRVPERKANLLWLGDRKAAKKAILFLHGGGYIIPMTTAHIEWCWNAYVQPSEGRIAVAMLQYNLIPEATFPSQLHDVASALPLLFDAGFAPGDIVVGGDSAGGNLTMLLLHHLLRPHPAVPAVTMQGKLAAAFVVSPWLTAGRHTPAFARNATNDMFGYDTVVNLNRKFLAIDHLVSGQDDNGWSVNPIGVDESWLRDLANVTPKLLITAGYEEVLLDSSLELAEKLKRLESTVDVMLDVNEGQAHDWILVEAFQHHVGVATKTMVDWITKVFEL